MCSYIANCFANLENADVTIKIGSHKLRTHSLILAAASVVFEGLLFSSNNFELDLDIGDALFKPFKILLIYLQTGRLAVQSLRWKDIFGVLHLSRRYEVKDLEDEIVKQLEVVVNGENVLQILTSNNDWKGYERLKETFFGVVDGNVERVLESEDFCKLSDHLVLDILTRDSFCTSESDIFDALHRWIKANQPGLDTKQRLIACIRFPVMSNDDFIKAWKLYPEIGTYLGNRDEESFQNFRGQKILNENVAVVNRGASAEGCQEPFWLLASGPRELRTNIYRAYSMSSGYGSDSSPLPWNTSNFDPTYHFSDSNFYTSHQFGEDGILVDLGGYYLVNTIKLMLQNFITSKEGCIVWLCFKYYVEVSRNRLTWTKISNHSNVWCRQQQTLYFSDSVIKYVRIVGVGVVKTETGPKETYFNEFACKSLEVLYSSNVPKIVKNFICPVENIATHAMATVNVASADNVFAHDEILLNGDLEVHRGITTPFTSHKLGGGGYIWIRFFQAYWVDRVKIRLWDFDQRKQCYSIEAFCSEDGSAFAWELIVDDRDFKEGMNVIEFPAAKIVSEFKIIGRLSTKGDDLRLVHFEASCSQCTPQENDEREIKEFLNENVYFKGPHPKQADLLLRDNGSLIVDLSANYMISNVSFELEKNCGYYVELSMNFLDWVKVADNSKFSCRQGQDLYFARTVVRYIKICVTSGTCSKISSLIVQLTDKEKSEYEGSLEYGKNSIRVIYNQPCWFNTCSFQLKPAVERSLVCTKKRQVKTKLEAIGSNTLVIGENNFVFIEDCKTLSFTFPLHAIQEFRLTYQGIGVEKMILTNFTASNYGK